MPQCFFVSDLHGSVDRYERLFECIECERPAAVFVGGDLLPSGLSVGHSLDPMHEDFLNEFIGARLRSLRAALADEYPSIYLILGNDDPRFEEASAIDLAAQGLWLYAHERFYQFGPYRVYGYARIPPSPFQLKDWERYDVSRYVDPGCVSPEQGVHTVPVSESEMRYGTMTRDLKTLTGDDDLTNAIMLFHVPPYQTKLDRAALDGKMIDHVPIDVHIGSIAVRRLIEKREPLVTLHGHVHESAAITGAWRDSIGSTVCMSAAHDGPELALVRFDPANLDAATRELIA